MIRAALYIRVSTQEQAIHGLSVEAQRANLETWAKANHIHVVGIYADEGISARKPASRRPGLQRLLNDVRNRNVDLIVFTKLDRWFRNVSEYYKVQEILEQNHVDWKTIQEDYDTSTASGRLKINIMLAVAQDEADRTSERIKVVFENKRQRQEALTGNCPYGYIIEGKRLVKDPETEEGVDAFFQKFLVSASTSDAMAAALEHGAALHYQQAYRMLKSEAYFGRYFGADGMCPPYITKEEFDRIQDIRARRAARKAPKNRTFIFSGLILCGECGKRMSGGVNQNKKSPNYRCQRHYHPNPTCGNNVCIVEWKIERHIMGSIGQKMEIYKANAMRVFHANRTRNYSSEMSALRARISRLKELFLNELISLDEYRQDKERMEVQLAELAEKSRTQKEPDFSAAESLLAKDWQSKYLELDKDAKREFWRLMIREIRIYPDRHIEFDLNF